jgi:O-antigen/teichoic acid export membrane protein
LRKIFENSGWLLGDKLSKLFPGIIVMALIARHLGPEQFGIWSYALALTTIVGNLSILGTDRTVVKELVNNPDRQPAIVATMIMLRLAASALAVAICVVFILAVKGNNKVFLYCTILSGVLIMLQSFDIFDYFYQARDDVKRSIIPKVSVFVVFCAIKVVAIYLDLGLTAFLWISVFELLFTYLIITIGYRWYMQQKHIFREMDFGMARALLAESWPLISSNLVVVLFVKVDLLLLDYLGNTVQLGEYVVAARISELWYALPAVVSTAILPSLLHKKNTDTAAYLRALEKWLRLCFYASMLISIAVSLLAPLIITVLYSNQYAHSVSILTIHIWASIPVFLCSVIVNYLVIEGQYKVTLLGNLAGLVVNVGLNIILIPLYGGVGSATATVISYMTAYLTLLLLDKNKRGAHLTQKMLSPVLAFRDVRQLYLLIVEFFRKDSLLPSPPPTEEKNLPTLNINDMVNTCRICGHSCEHSFTGTIMGKYNVTYYSCENCGFVQTEKPYWLNEAYEKPINLTDTGLVRRNILAAKSVSVIIFFLFGKDRKYLDYAGGYGLFTRLMRNYGFDFYSYDPYTANLLAQGFPYNPKDDIAMLTSFECFEHFENPIPEIDRMLNISRNIFFSTQLIPDPAPPLSEWWYYGAEHGQHVAFYRRKTLQYIAKKYGLHVYSIRGYHLLTEHRISKWLFVFLTGAGRFGLDKVLSLFMKSRVMEDMRQLRGKPQEILK